MLALLRHAKTRDDPASVRAVESAFSAYRAYWAEHKTGPFVPWQVRAFAELHRIAPDPEYPAFCFEMQDWLLKEYPPVALSEGLGRAGSLTRAAMVS